MLAALFRRRPSLPVVSIPKQTQPALFKQNPPWWARWALVLVALDVMVASVLLYFEHLYFTDSKWMNVPTVLRQLNSPGTTGQ